MGVSSLPPALAWWALTLAHSWSPWGAMKIREGRVSLGKQYRDSHPPAAEALGQMSACSVLEAVRASLFPRSEELARLGMGCELFLFQDADPSPSQLPPPAPMGPKAIMWSIGPSSFLGFPSCLLGTLHASFSPGVSAETPCRYTYYSPYGAFPPLPALHLCTAFL